MNGDPSTPAPALNVRGPTLSATDTPERYREKIARITLDSMGQFVGLLNAKGTVLEINQVALDTAGIKLADVEGQPFWTTFWWQVSEEINATLRDSIARAAQGEFVRWDTPIYGRAGGKDMVIIEASLRPVKDEQGQVAFIVAEGRDITEQKTGEREIARQREELAHSRIYGAAVEESERRYRLLFESIDEGFCVIEMLFDEQQRPVDYRFLEINPAFEKQAGMHGATGKRMLEFVAEIEAHWLENYGRVALTGEPIRFANEYKSLGSWFDVYAFRVGDSQSRKVAVLFNNITQEKESEIALRASEERARAASLAKDNFLAQLSHELRTPLTPVLMTAAELREDSRLPGDVREQLAMIERNVSLEARLIDDLLDLTSITRGKLNLRSELCDLHSLLGLVVEIVRDDARDRQIEIALDLAAQRSFLSGDPARLQQVFWNLLRNAVKFTPDGGHIRIRSRDGTNVTGAQGCHPICIEVSDDGIGFADDMATRLFEPFEQGTASNDQRFPGLGLGLAIARAIVDLHGGQIRAESPGCGQGATFTVELPGAQPPSSPLHSPADDATLTGPEPLLRLLLVEDHEPTLNVLMRLLTRAGHRVTTAGSVADALAAAQVETFDAVMSDLGLPDGTGLELMELLRDRHNLRGIALSGYGMDEDLRRSHEAGFVAHLIKPVDVNEVRRTLRQFAPGAGQ